MNWLNLEVSVLHSPEYIGSDPVARASWLSVLLWAVQQECSGRIAGAAAWKDRQWQQTCGVMRAEIDAAAPLLRWDGEDLVIHAYPVEKESEVREKREAGRLGGSAKSKAKADAARENGRLGGRFANNPSTTQAETEATTQAEPKQEPKGMEPKQEPNGKERKGKEGNNTLGELIPPSPAQFKNQSDEEWIRALASNPAYSGLNVTLEYEKLKNWCAVNRAQPTRRRFINWLNRADKPLNAGSIKQSVRIAV